MPNLPLIVTTALDTAFDYRPPENLSKNLSGGEIFQVPFGQGHRPLLAVHFTEPMINHRRLQKKIPDNKLKSPLVNFADPPFNYPPLTQDHLEFLTIMADYYGGQFGAPLGAVVKMALPALKVFDKKFMEKRTAKKTKPDTSIASSPILDFPFTPEQQQAIDHINDHIKDGDHFAPHVLHGITGSGKTAVYFSIMKKILARGKNILVLLPEIALTNQWQKKFSEFFGDEVKLLLWHSHLSAKQRTDYFYQILSGNQKPMVLMGARSALLLPLKNIGLIVVDEEHDSSYKQQSGVRYHARDMAVVRAKTAHCPIILSSATLSLETRHNVDAGKYTLTLLKNRFSQKPLPTIQLIDLKKTPPAKNDFISAPLEQSIHATLAKNEQALLFLNRRGYAPISLCVYCGEKLTCRHCAVYLVKHGASHYHCHRCDWFITDDQLKNQNGEVACPSCHRSHGMMLIGPGVERILEEAKRKFPDAKIAVASSDNIKKEKDLENFINDMVMKKIDIVIGTQLIAKGHDFPYLSLVGVILTDQFLLGEDPRAMEKTWQVLEQVIGRAGRHDTTSHATAMLQTYHPSEPLLTLLQQQQPELFWQKLLAERQAGLLPPFGRLALLTLSNNNENFLSDILKQMKGRAGNIINQYKITLFGPAPSPISKLKNQYRYRFLLVSAYHQTIISFIKQWLPLCDDIKGFRRIKLEIDIDPQDFL